MNKFTDHDEYLHYGYPLDKARQWKENYYFNLIDEPNKVFGICHFSIRRTIGKAVFTFNCLADGHRIRHINVIDWPLYDRSGLSDSLILSDGCLSLEIVEPFKEHRVTFRKDDTSLDITYTRRFDPFFYEKAEDQAAGEENVLAQEHYEQVVFAKGGLSVGDRSIPIDCFAHRDHSWGFRDESTINGWNWTSIAFPNSGWNFTQVRSKDLSTNENGFISSSGGNRAISGVTVNEVFTNENGEPEGAHYSLTTSDGETINVKTRCLDRMVLPMNREKTTVVYENLTEFIIEETGERGIGIDEHMVNR